MPSQSAEAAEPVALSRANSITDLAEASVSSGDKVFESLRSDQSLRSAYSTGASSAFGDGGDDDADSGAESFLRIHALVEGDRYIRQQLREIRSSIRRDAASNPVKRSSKLDSSFQRRRLTLIGSRGLSRSATRALEASTRGAKDSRCLNLVRKLCGPVLHPDGRFRTTWNATMVFLIYYCAVAIPLDIVFEDEMKASMCRDVSSILADGACIPHRTWKAINYTIDALFVLDIIVNLRTGYHKEGQVVLDDAKAAGHYLRHSFITDLVGSFPINLVVDCDLWDSKSDACGFGRGNRFLRMLRLFKLAKLTRMLKLNQYFDYIQFITKTNPGLLRLFRLCIFSILCCHWFGCIWWLVSDYELLALAEEEALLSAAGNGTHNTPGGASRHLISEEFVAGENTWMTPPWMKNSPDFGLQYSHAFFWGAGIAFGMTPFDIEPLTAPEALVTTLLMFCGLLLNAFTISSFTSAFAAIDSKNALAGKQLDIIRNYLQLKAVAPDIRARILEYFQYIFTSSQSMDDVGQLQHMPPNLTTQLALSINAKLVARCAFFEEVSNTALVALVTALEPIVFVLAKWYASKGSHYSLCTSSIAARSRC